ncbi:MAG: DUF2264 domain-containing protein [Candidatus Dadabacteria bacterium]
MSKKILFALLAIPLLSVHGYSQDGLKERKEWLGYMDKIARPVLSNLAQDRLKEKMPVQLSKRIDNKENRSKVAYLEAFGRVLAGISPWLNVEGGSKEEIALRNQYRTWTLKAIANAVNPNAKDYMKWTGGQPLVDASFFALGLVRAPWLWEHLDTAAKINVIEALKQTRATVPGYTNWILFSGMIEAFFCKYGYDYDPLRIEYDIREFSQHWYVGDGMFSDGMQFHNDYYNSYVIQPYLATILSAVSKKTNSYNQFADRLKRISSRYAELQERMVNTDGSFPVIGRSITYRGGAFHLLADISLRKQLPSSLPAAQVRSALGAVIRKTLQPASTFTKDGWLSIGVYGEQQDLADGYITTGSEYLCTTIFLPLGLSAEDEFWSAPAMPWTAVKVWTGMDTTPADHALDIKD